MDSRLARRTMGRVGSVLLRYDRTPNGELDSDGDSCGAYYRYGDSLCVGYEDSDFTATEMCCACGGGDTRFCENMDNGAKNSLGQSCVDVAIRHNHGYSTCKADWDTPTFTASSMCCACGGGQTITPTSETCEHTSGNHLDIEFKIQVFHPTHHLHHPNPS